MRRSGASSTITPVKPACANSSAKSPPCPAKPRANSSATGTTPKPLVFHADGAEGLSGRGPVLPKLRRRIKEYGIATGLAWTPVGGEILFIEATRMPGKGGLLLTGSLGDVMKESAQTALSYSAQPGPNARDRFRITANTTFTFTCPAGATPKDGPSAGVTVWSPRWLLC